MVVKNCIAAASADDAMSEAARIEEVGSGIAFKAAQVCQKRAAVVRISGIRKRQNLGVAVAAAVGESEVLDTDLVIGGPQQRRADGHPLAGTTIVHGQDKVAV